MKRIDPFLANDEELITRFQQEARIAASIHHPNVIEIFDVGRDREGMFIAMEYLQGESIIDIRRWRDGQGVPVPIAVRIGCDAASGLEAAHAVPIVHRDITPSNVIICYNGRTKLLDFGIAQSQIDARKDRSAEGQLPYMAPEVIAGGAADERSDVYQLGLLLYELLTGDRTFIGESDEEVRHAILHDEIPRLTDTHAVPLSFDNVIARAMARDPAQRFQSATELLTALEACLAEVGAPTAKHVSAWMKSEFSERYERRLDMEEEAQEIDRAHFGPGAAPPADEVEATRAVRGARASSDPVWPAGSSARTSPVESRRRLLLAASVVVLLVTGVGLWRGLAASDNMDASTRVAPSLDAAMVINPHPTTPITVDAAPPPTATATPTPDAAPGKKSRPSRRVEDARTVVEERTPEPVVSPPKSPTDLKNPW